MALSSKEILGNTRQSCFFLSVFKVYKWYAPQTLSCCSPGPLCPSRLPALDPSLNLCSERHSQKRVRLGSWLLAWALPGMLLSNRQHLSYPHASVQQARPWPCGLSWRNPYNLPFSSSPVPFTCPQEVGGKLISRRNLTENKILAI